MTEAKHTPGPWRISPFGSQTGLEITIMGADDYAVARCNDRTPREHMADARLIAAAPDLLAALKECVCEICHCRIGWAGAPHSMRPPDCFACRDARAAIAKAEGRGGQP